MKCNWIPDLLRKLQGPEKADGLCNVIPCCQTVSILKIISIFCRLLNGLARSSAENKNLPILNKLRSLKIVLALKCFGLERKYLTITLCRPKKKNCVAPTQCEHHSTRYQKNHEWKDQRINVRTLKRLCRHQSYVQSLQVTEWKNKFV